MKTAAWGAFMVSVAALAVGCGSGSSNATGSGGAGGADTTTTGSTTTVTTTVGAGMPTTTTTTTTTASSVMSSSSGMMNCGTFVFDPDAKCQACMTDLCCTELADCGPDCSALLACFGTCAANDKACASKCAADHPAGVNPVKALFTCFQGSCENDKRCAGFPICDSGLHFPDNPALEACATCLGSKCCMELTACANDADGSCLDCFNTPTGAGCSTDMLGTAANNCRSMNCAMDCSK